MIATRLGLAALPRRQEIISRARICGSSRSPVCALPRRLIVSTADGDCGRTARRRPRGLPVTCDTHPPYFALNETAIGDYRTFASSRRHCAARGTAGR